MLPGGTFVGIVPAHTPWCCEVFVLTALPDGSIRRSVAAISQLHALAASSSEEPPSRYGHHRGNAGRLTAPRLTAAFDPSGSLGRLPLRRRTERPDGRDGWRLSSWPSACPPVAALARPLVVKAIPPIVKCQGRMRSSATPAVSRPAQAGVCEVGPEEATRDWQSSIGEDMLASQGRKGAKLESGS